MRFRALAPNELSGVVRLGRVIEITEYTKPRAPFDAPADLRAALDAPAEDVRIASGGCIFSAGSEATGVYLVRQGTVRAFLPSSQGRELVCRTLGPGTLPGLPAAMCAKSHQFTATAVEDVHLALLSTEKLNDCLRRRSDLCMTVVGMMSDELAELRRSTEHLRNCTHTECSLHDACSHDSH